MSLPRATAWRWLLALLLVFGLAMALRALAPGAGPENWFAGADKLLHLSYFALLWCVAVRAQVSRAGSRVLGLLGFGIGIELAQGWLTATRSASLADVLADGAGLLLGAVLTCVASNRQPEKDRR